MSSWRNRSRSGAITYAAAAVIAGDGGSREQGQRALWEGEAEWRTGAFGLCLLEALTCVSV